MQPPITGHDHGGVPRFDIRSTLSHLYQSSYFKNILNGIKILIGLVLFYLSVHGVQWGDLMIGIRSADLAWLIVAIFFVLFGLFLKIYRWAIFIRNYQITAGSDRLFRAYFVGQAANIVLPFRSGELIRIGYFADQPHNLPEVTSTIVLEKYLDLVALTICGIVISLKVSIDNLLNLRGVLLPVTIMLTVLLLLVILYGPRVWGKIKTISWFPVSLRVWLDRLLEVSQWLKKPQKVMPSIWLTILIWVVMWSTNLILFRSLGLSLGGIAAGLVLTLVYVGLFPALMPGNIGPFYFFTRLALSPFGIKPEDAIIFAVTLHAIVMLPPLLAGGISLLVPNKSVVKA
jgi:uncharacterized membrane protein YbhN (UPF0104 family)